MTNKCNDILYIQYKRQCSLERTGVRLSLYTLIYAVISLLAQYNAVCVISEFQKIFRSSNPMLKLCKNVKPSGQTIAFLLHCIIKGKKEGFEKWWSWNDPSVWSFQTVGEEWQTLLLHMHPSRGKNKPQQNPMSQTLPPCNWISEPTQGKQHKPLSKRMSRLSYNLDFLK